MPYSRLKKSLLYTLLTLLTLCLFSTVSLARSRCQVKESQLLSLSKRLDRAEFPGAWQTIYKESLVALELIEKKLFGTNSKTNISPRQARAQLLCVQELLFESSFFLSDDRVKGYLWSMRSLGHAVSLSSLNPVTLSSLENKDRLKLLLKRINRRKKGRQKLKKNFKLGTYQTLSIPAQSKPYQLSLKIKQQAEWLKQCGLFEGCKEASFWKVYPLRNTALNFSLPASEYELEWSGACVQHKHDLSVSSHQSPAGTITVPKMSCFSEIELFDKLTGEVIPVLDLPIAERPQVKVGNRVISNQDQTLKVAENSVVFVHHHGYKPTTAITPRTGAKVSIPLSRCAVKLVFKTQPKTLDIEGPKRVYWGQPYTIKFKKNGYIPLSKLITVATPKQCSNAKHLVDVKLTRQVEVKAYDPQGLKVKLTSLEVGGLSLNPQLFSFRRPEGLYQVVAQTQGYPQLKSQLKVSPCQDQHCEQTSLNLYFQNPPPIPMTTKTRLKWAGTSLLSAGLGLFIYNSSAHRYRDRELNYSTPLIPIQERMKSLNQWSIALVSSGLFTVALGYAWPYLISNQNDLTTKIASPQLQKGKH